MKNSYQPILFNKRVYQSQSTSYINSAGNNSQKSKIICLKTIFSKITFLIAVLKKMKYYRYLLVVIITKKQKGEER